MSSREYLTECGGLNTQWDSEDRDEVLDHHKRLWREWKRENGHPYGTPIQEIDGFLESIQALYDYGYSLTDIGVFFGLSRERIRQYFEQYDQLDRYDTGRASYRLWDDDAECFLPVNYEEMEKAVRQGRIRAKRRDFEERRAAIVRAIRGLADKLGRPPTLDEIEDETGRHKTVLATWWGYSHQKGGRTFRQAWNAMYAAAGIHERPHPESTKNEGRFWHGEES